MPNEPSDPAEPRPLPPEDWNPALSFVIDDMNGAPLNVHKLMAHHPDLLKAWWNFRNYSVKGGDLGRRKGELVILRVAILLRAWYEWASHVERALAYGLHRDEIERVKQGPDAPGWNTSEALLLTAGDELVANHGLTRETAAGPRQHFSVQQIMDIMAIHGMYVILGCMINTWGLELDAEAAAKLPDDVTRQAFETEFPR